MTGEISLTGRVLPIGGLKEKALAAMRAGITKIIIPDKNVKDLEDLDDEYRRKLEFIPVKHIDEAIAIALTEELKLAPLDEVKQRRTSGKTKPSKRASTGQAA
jgi:ATP-dependent Lon protease